MGTSIRFRLFLSCFAVIAIIVFAVDLSTEGSQIDRHILELFLSLLGAIAMTWVFSSAIAWRVQRLKTFAEHVLDTNNVDEPLPEEGEETALLNQSLRRMAARIRELVDRLESRIFPPRRHPQKYGGRRPGGGSPDARAVLQPGVSAALGLRHPVEENTPLVGLVRDPKFLSLISGVLSSGEPVQSKLQFAVEDSSVFEAYVGPLEVPPHRGALVILHDITGMERLERIRRDFVANVSHELRTPLTAIRGYAETLLSGALADTENNRRFIEIIQAHAIRLNNIASDLLTLSDLESGRRDVEPGPISVEEAINTALPHGGAGSAHPRRASGARDRCATL